MNPLHKFFSPRLSTLVLRRARLVEMLVEATADDNRPSAGLGESTLSRLILVHGPAGYGKTTVLADFARQTDLPCCWYFLDETDRNPILFLQGLLSSLCHCFPQFSQMLDLNTAHLITEDIQNAARMRAFEMFIDKLTLTLEKEVKQKFLLILCNYHVVNAHQGIQHLTQHLLQHLPSHCLLIIESRSLPELDLSSFVLHGSLLVLGAERLSFTAQEVYDLAKLRGIAHIGRAEAEQLATNFDGWIAGILLGTYFGDMRFLSSRQDTSEQWKFPALQTGQKQLVNYVLNEVFESKLDLFTFLQEISLLPYITIELCNDLLEISDAEERLTYIEQQGLFITRGGDTGSPVYFCHPVLRELFCRELRERNPARCLYLHRRVATLFLQQEEYAQAITHAIYAREYQLAAEALAQFSQHMLVQGYSETIAGWIDMLPDEVIGVYPPLLLSRANIFLMQYKADIALPLLDRALESIAHPHGEKAWPPTVQGDVLIARGFALFQQGEYLQAQASCEQAIQLLPEEEHFLRALAYQRLGVCRGAMGDCKGGIVYLQQSLQLWGHQTLNRQTAFLYGQLAKSYNLLGNYTLAQHHRTRALYCWEQLDDLEGKVNSLVGMGVTYLHQGMYTEAEFFLNQALTIARAQHFSREEAYALINLGELRQEQQQYEQALADTEAGLILARQYQDSYLINYALCSLAWIYLLLDDSSTPPLLLAETKVRTLPQDRMSYEECFRELTCGTILLSQQHYEEAAACLQTVENVTNKAGWKRRQLQVCVRLSACQLALGQSAAVAQTVEKALTLAHNGGQEHLFQIELHRQPTLTQVIRKAPEQESQAEPSPEEAKDEHATHERQGAWSIQVSQPSLRTLALGLPTVLSDNKPIARWRMTKALELYFFLLNSDRSVHKEQIITALWPNANEQTDQAFRSATHFLRRAIGEACVIQHAGVYELNLAVLYGDRTWYDVAAFQDLYACGNHALTLKDDEAARQAFQDMVDLYRGDYVQTFYSDWCRQRRDELQRMYMDALTQIAQICWRAENVVECLSWWNRLLKIDNCREDAHHGVMRCYLRQGKRTLALRQYQDYEEILREELSAAPGPSIQRFYQRLMQS